MKTKLFTLLLAIVVSIGTMFARTKIGDLYYNLNSTDKTAEVTYEMQGNKYNYNGLTTANIPVSVTYNGTTYSVTSIGESAFLSCSRLTSITIPNSVTSIGREAFSGCTSLTSVTIPNSVTSIGTNAFQECTGLTSVTIPNSVTSIGDWAFRYCSGLTSVTIPNSVTSIGWYAFYGCTGLTSVTIPNSVTSIGGAAFSGCTSLTSVTIPNSVTSIGTYAFQECTGLTSVTIPNSVTSIGNYAFSWCWSLTSINVASDNPNYCSAEGVLFNKDKTKLIQYPVRDTRSEYIIPNSVTSIGDAAFVDCYNLTSVTIPNSVTSIGDFAFYFCRGLTSMTIEVQTPPTIGNGVFEDCPAEIYVPCGTLETYKTAWPDYGSLIKYAPLSYKISTLAENGSIQVSSKEKYTICDEQPYYTLAVVTNYGYHFTQWSDGNTNNPRTIVLTQDTTFTAELAKNTYTISTVSANPEWGTTAGDTAALYLDEIEISAIPNYGYHFVRWNDNNTSNPRIVSVTEDKTFTATFAKNIYSITKNAEHGSISGNSSAEYLDEVTLTVTAYNGYHFTQWSDGNTDNPRTIVVTQDTTMEAIFDYLLTGSCGQNNALTWTLDTTSLSLNISGSGALSKNYTYGTFIKSLTIEDEITQIGENAFANFINLKKVTFGTGVKVLEQKAFYNCSAIDTIFCYSQRPPTVNTNALYGLSYNTVVYVPAAYLNNYLMHDSWGLYDVRPLGLALQLSVNIPESGEVFGAGSYEKGATTTISATPNYGYHFVQWNDGNTDNPRMIIITQDTAFVANFAPNQYSISVNCDKAYGRIEGKTGKFDYKTQHTYTVIPNYGYHFAKWSDGNTANPRTLTLTQDTILTASFAKNSYTITLQSANPEQGAVAGSGTFEYLEQKQISAIPNYGYHLDKWSDGNTDNPRTITLTQDTILTAYFAVDKSGTCGKDNILQWSFSEDRKLTISGKGELTANYTFGVEAPTQMKTLIIGNEVTAIGERAFYGKSTINHLVLGAQLSTIGDYAFAECKNFDDITCYAQGVPAINATTFANVGNKQYIYLYVPEDRERAYKRDTYWGEFDVQVKGASETTTDQNVTVTPNENSAIVTWPTDKNAATYTLQITKDGVVFCTLIFNGAGQLIGISFAPSRDGSSHAPAATVSVAGMSFTVTGLSSASKYAYNLSVADDNNQELVYYQGEFATTGYEGEVVPGGEPVIPGGGTTAIDNVNSANQPVGTTKFFRNGQLFIQRGNELFNAQGARVK